MQSICTQCQAQFEITPEEKQLLKKLSPSIGEKTYELLPPAHCPNCRQRQRMAFRNERILYKRKCDVTGKSIVSIYAEDSPYKVCNFEDWYAESFDPFAYGIDYDPSRSFFEQFLELQQSIPLPSLRVEQSENCDFNSDMRACKNCYLCSRTHESENMLYTYRGNTSRDCMDCTQVTKSELLYECVECVQCYNGKYLFFCSDCTDSAFLLDCRNCISCFMCCNMRNKQYCFLNEQLTKEEYEAKLKDFHFGSQTHVDKAYRMYADIQKKTVRRNLMIINCEDCTGDNLFTCKGCKDCFSVQDSESCMYLWDVKKYRDSMDAYTGGRDSELVYNSTSASNSYGCLCCVRASGCSDTAYSYFLTAAKHCFGCIGMRNTSYCILNKEYSPEEYEKTVAQIIQSMIAEGVWGQFFPTSLSPFPYNDTVAYEYFPLEPAQVQSLGYRWREKDPKEYQPQTVELPDSIEDTGDDVCSQLLACSGCGKNYKITERELKYYRDHTIAIPRKCPDCRHMQRLHSKNPPAVNADTCRRCNKEMISSFPEGTQMQVYCEECYLSEVY